MGLDLPEGAEIPPELLARLPDQATLPGVIGQVRAKLAELPAAEPAPADPWPALRRQLEAAALIQAERLPGVAPPYLRFHPTLAPLLWVGLEAEERAQPAPDAAGVACRWLGPSALRPEGSLTLPRAPNAVAAGLPERFAIDLAPLLTEVAAGRIAGAESRPVIEDLREAIETRRTAVERQAPRRQQGYFAIDVRQ
jgi:hypothetical protein